MVPDQRERRRWARQRPMTWAVVMLALLVAIGAIGWYVGAWGRSGPTISALVSGQRDIHAVEATEDLCKDPVCVEGWRTDYGNYLRFASEGEAEYWVTVLGDDGRRWKTLVLDMRAVDLSFDQKRRAIDLLFSGKDWN